MDKLGSFAKDGWHPGGDRQIKRETWKQDLKGMATGKKQDPYEEARNHQSAPLSTLKDPSSFGPPPKHNAYYGAASSAASTPQASKPAGGWGAPVPAPSRSFAPQEPEPEEPRPPPKPYRTDTTGLRTDNLPKPPSRRTGDSPGLPPRAPPRQVPAQPSPAPPPRLLQAQPSLPPRQNEYPHEHTPAPPPPYEAARQTSENLTAISSGAVKRLGQAGVSVPGFNIGGGSTTTPQQSPARGVQLSELQQRFARLNTDNGSDPSPPSTPTTTAATLIAAAHKKAPPPPPPPKKAALVEASSSRPASSQGAQAPAPAPPPLPLASKPRFP